MSEEIIVVRIEGVGYEEKPKGRREECEVEDKDGWIRSRWLKCGWYFSSLQKAQPTRYQINHCEIKTQTT